MGVFRHVRLGVVAWLLAGLAIGASAATPRYLALDLPDTGSADRRALEISFDGPFEPFGSLELSFAPADFAALAIDTAPAGMGGTYLEQPSPGLDGLVNFSATRAIAPGETFTARISFDWLGTGAPGSQPWQRYAADFTTISEGLTTPVPEPSAAALLLLGLGIIAARRLRVRDASP